MGKAAKTILDALKAARVPAAAQKRAKDLIDEAHDWDETQAAEVGAVVSYVCGAVPELPKKLSKEFVEHRTSELLHGLSRGRTLDDWDMRALDVLARGRTMYWFWELDSWLRARVVKFPDQPIFEEALELFRARDVWETDEDIIASMVNHLTGHVTEKGELTSTGRWLLARLDRDADGVFKVARAQKDDETSSLYRLLLAHRRELFERLVPKLALKEDSDKSFLAEVMLDADAKYFEKQALGLMADLTSPGPAIYSARNLVRYFPGKYRAELKQLLLVAIAGKSVHSIFDGEASSSREEAYKMAWKVLKEDAFEIWKAYAEENDALRLDFYETIEKQAKAKALPWLVDGLVYPKDPNAEYGFVTHAKYVARMLQILKPYDLAPYRERIEKTFAKTKDKKIRELVDGIFETKRGAKAKQPAKKKVAPFDAKKGFCLDVYATAVATAALAATKKQKTMPSPIELVKLGGYQGEVQLNALIIEGVGEPVTLMLKVPKTRIPGHVDMDDGAVLAQFAKRHGLEGDEVPSWGDMYKLPWCVLIHEQILAVNAIAAGLKKQGHKLAKKCEISVGEDDSSWESSASFARMSREEVAALPQDQQADFAAVCFADPKKQKWLLKA